VSIIGDGHDWDLGVVGRRKRKVWLDAEKRTICAQTRVPGVSVSQVARRYDANANLVFAWLRDPRFRPDEATVERQMAFLPVEVIEERREARRDIGASAPAAVAAVEGCIELELASGHWLRVVGTYDPEALARLIRGLSA
jgi:transposase